VSPPAAPASESEQLWRLLRAVSGQVAELQERVADLERRDDLAPLREQLRDLAREVAALGDDLRDLLATDRASAIEVLAHRTRTPPAPRPVTSLGPPQAVRAHLRAWVGWAMVALAGATATALTAAFLALARGCG
jgi:ABC-type transporter Mla subunit MlaD